MKRGAPKPGQTLELGRHVFTPAEITAFAGAFDFQPFHLSDEAAAKTHFGGLSASGWHTAAAFSKLFATAWNDAGYAPISGHWQKMRNLRWSRPVRAGDTLNFSAEIIAVEPDRMTVRGEATNQNGEEAYAFEADIEHADPIGHERVS